MRISRERVVHPQESLRCLHLELNAFRAGLHRHGHAELTWIERGQGLRWVGDSVEPFFDGDLVLLGRDVVHTWASRGEDRPGGCHATVLQFPAEWARRTGLPELSGVAPLMLQARRGLHLQGATRDAAVSLLLRIRAAVGARRVGAFVELLGVLLEGQADLRPLACDTGPGEGGADRAARRIDPVLAWVENHLGEELRVEQAAALAHVTPAAFARFFRREVGKGFIEYLNDARCSWAALCLMESRAPVSQIAQECGFAALSNFGEQFRRRYGVSPRDFRKASGREQ